jgi:hypothetical protein
MTKEGKFHNIDPSSSFTQLPSHDVTSEGASSPKRRSASLEPQHVTFCDESSDANGDSKKVQRNSVAVENVAKNNVKFYIDKNDSVEDILSFDVESQTVRTG